MSTLVCSLVSTLEGSLVGCHLLLYVQVENHQTHHNYCDHHHNCADSSNEGSPQDLVCGNVKVWWDKHSNIWLWCLRYHIAHIILPHNEGMQHCNLPTLCFRSLVMGVRRGGGGGGGRWVRTTPPPPSPK